MKKPLLEKEIITILEAEKKAKRKRELAQEWAAFVVTEEASPNKKIIPLYKKYAIAASILFLFSIGFYWVMTTSKSTTPMAIASDYGMKVTAPTLSIYASQTENNTEEKMKEISLIYNGNQYKKIEPNYPKTIQLINQYFTADIPISLLQARAISYYKTGNYKKAVADFESFIAYENDIPIDNALWFLALTYLKTTPPQVSKAQKTREKLIAIYDSKDKIAQDLLNDLADITY